MTGWSVELVPGGSVPPAVVRELRRDLALCLDRRVSIAEDELELDPAYSPERQQYAADVLMAALLETAAPVPDQRRMGVVGEDLFLPVFTHVFGSAQYQGTVAVVSTHRLSPIWSEQPSDPRLLRLRLLKEAMHELGHTLGLVHCKVPWCVMSPSLDPDHVDLKDPAFCAPCAETIGVPQDRTFMFLK